MCADKPVQIEGKNLSVLNDSERKDLIAALYDDAAEASSDLMAFAVALKGENYETALTWLEAAKDKVSKIDELLTDFVHHHRRGKI
jgi:hypothetical protein